HLLDTPTANHVPFVFPNDQPTNSSSNLRDAITPIYSKAHSEPRQRFRWGPAFGESLLYTGIMHAFDITTQAGTRDALNGPWFDHYMQSVAALRGWSDSDRF